MRRIVLSTALVALLLSAVSLSVWGVVSASPSGSSHHQGPSPFPGSPVSTSLWPKPTNATFGTNAVQVDSVAFEFTGPSGSDVLDAAFDRYTKIIFPKKTGQGAGITSVDVQVKDLQAQLQLGVDESYELEVGPSGGSIHANTVWGALRGLETFSQLVVFDGSKYWVTASPVLIEDKPRFQWRGFLMDTARHYYPVDFILHIVDSLSYSKFNTLHWHMVDAQTFPYQSPAYPKIAENAVWCPQCTYSQSDIKKVVDYARLRGVRVVPEFDAPGHSWSIGQGYPELTVDCPSYEHNVNNIPLNPTINATYVFLQKLFSEVQSMFPDQYVHTGGDEVVYGCWAEDPNIVAFMNSHGFGSDYNKLLGFFEDNLDIIISGIQRTPVVWQEVFQSGANLPTHTVVESWKDKETLYQAIRAGYKGILAAGYYLDQQIPGEPTNYGWEDTWKNFYNNDPVDPGQLNPQQASLVIGGEACMWSEAVDAVNFDSRVWPRACAVAERLWSAATVDSTTEALPRLQAQQCRLVNRGVGAGPVAPGYCQVW